jgi:hypothetical protein
MHPQHSFFIQNFSIQAAKLAIGLGGVFLKNSRSGLAESSM